MGERPLVLVHGYAGGAGAFDAWRARLRAAGYPRDSLRVVHFRSLSDDVGLPDLAEGLERALSLQPGLGDGAPFDAMVHSTGMLVVLSWLAARPERRARLKRLIGLAPASFGSPLAHKGRGMLGALFRGNRRWGPDFLEAGDRILDALELGGRASWSLAWGASGYGAPAVGSGRNGAHGSGPLSFAFCGTEGYPFPRSLANEPGSDGAVRLAGCVPDARRVRLDLTRDGRRPRARRLGPTTSPLPLIPVAGCHHASILDAPTEPLVELVLGALTARGRAGMAAWESRARSHRRRVLEAPHAPAPWQQLVVRVVDERGEPVPDYYVELLVRDAADRWRPAHDLRDPHQAHAQDVHVYGADRSYRCFHLDLARLPLRERPVALRLIAHSGTDLVGYRGYRQRLRVDDGRPAAAPWDGIIELSGLARRAPLFERWSTLLVEVRLDREPLPVRGPTRLVRFPARAGAVAEDGVD